MMTIARIASVAFILGSAALAASNSSAQASREAGAAAEAKRQGQLTTKGDEQYQKNALARCQRQPAGTAREACEKRVMGTGETTTRGSVEGGGKLRSNTMQVPAPEAPKK
ncbi:hypothetical protein QTI24_24840 [Variovorax sp. J22P240]|uniref:hypothetical protein n=1 Tax=Variovorax sp. J22P240 TaxID=3053514 RepID=UPI0025754ECC|nr:hypothetical protein [Variovorax sp. J22P240]MDM0001859.1 hypothetical protein [Variovorax sp. J22P240]